MYMVFILLSYRLYISQLKTTYTHTSPDITSKALKIALDNYIKLYITMMYKTMLDITI